MDQRKYDRSPDLLKTEVVAWLEKVVVPSEVNETDFAEHLGPLAQVRTVGLEVLILLDGTGN
jgi:hypothetical protein